MKKNTVGILFCAFFCCALVSAFDSSIQKQLVIVDSQQTYDLNPHTATYVSEAQIISGLYEGLFSYSPVNVEPVPALAASYTKSKDGLQWTISMRKNAVFSNGEKITAYAMRDSLIALLDPNLNAPYASLLDCIAGVEDYRIGKLKDIAKVGIKVADEYTLEIVLNSPTEHLSKILCHSAFSVVHTKPNVFSGAFVIDFQSDTELILKKNQNYWDAQSVAVPSIKIMHTNDPIEATYLFNIGKAHWLMSSVDFNKILASDSILIAPQFSTEYLFFKVNDKPWDNKDVRNALIKAAPVEILRKGYLIPAQTLVFPLSGYPKVAGIEKQDIAEAEKLLKKAGYGKNGKKLEIVIHIPDYDSYKDQIKSLASAWSDLGVHVSINASEPSRYLTDIKKSSAQVFTYTWIGDFADPLAFLELFKSNSSLNEAHWKNAEFDKLLAEASLLSDNTKRYEKLAEAEKLLLDSGVILPLSHTVSSNIIDLQEVGGWYENALDMHPFKSLYFTPAKVIPNLAQHK